VRVERDDGPALTVPGELLQAQPDGAYYLPLQRRQIEQREEIVIPLAVEELEVEKQVTTRSTRFTRHVDTRVERIEDAGFKEEINVERVAVNRPVDTPPAIRREGNVTIVPLVEEVLVVEKRLILREEVRITVKQRANPPVEETVRSERLEIEPPQAGE
jgi:stress response protein YsnF